MKRIALSTALVFSLAAPVLAEDAAEFNLLIAAAKQSRIEAINASADWAGVTVSSTNSSADRSNVFGEPTGR
ncbi:hypothetical protein ACFFUT_02630 [Pseudohalocynthiibacter aestuariivivens]|uniref:TolC family protein n=1 Tax=Pseudohalocynthiibacter aestuariivivens TaxID=1591409 RepID=A0ABV5JB52_9RHOB|nr:MULTISPECIES: hypothetical protein [Pseudohalocynthiibacter]MBS9715763.1 hypothetical protein [Pseudohalocynthiibacter aestuariivivens]MCK0101376.1 hypothetical protein [Pseudohalocynthiibacter sp. F2068]